MGHAVRPVDPLIFRDGRPFSAEPGARAWSLPFPLPQTVAGGFRSLVAAERGYTFATKDLAQEQSKKLLNITIKGPLLLEESTSGWEFMLPAPQDVLIFPTEGASSRFYPLLPSSAGTGLVHGEMTNLPAGLKPLFFIQKPPKAKPLPVPTFWTADAFSKWLHGDWKGLDVNSLGHDGPTREMRVHVRIQPDSQTGEDGMLFSTSGLEFAASTAQNRHQPNGGAGLDPTHLSAIRPLGLWLQADTEIKNPVTGSLGGERRLTAWEAGPKALPLPTSVSDEIRSARGARVLLLTPACFKGGFLPKDGEFYGAPVTAVALGRPLVASGWDLQKRQPKPTRRLVPAGAVYFVEFPTNWMPDDKTEWLKRMWWQNQADDEQDRRDGYGLTAVGLWREEAL